MEAPTSRPRSNLGGLLLWTATILLIFYLVFLGGGFAGIHSVELRTTSLFLIAAAFARPSMRIGRTLLPALLAIGCFDVLANSLFAVATNHGLLSLVAVAGSLYAAVTVLLARFVLGERLAPVQRGGVIVALIGVALIAGGA